MLIGCLLLYLVVLVTFASVDLIELDLHTPENLKELNTLVEGNFFLYPLQRFRA